MKFKTKGQQFQHFKLKFVMKNIEKINRCELKKRIMFCPKLPCKGMLLLFRLRKRNSRPQCEKRNTKYIFLWCLQNYITKITVLYDDVYYAGPNAWHWEGFLDWARWQTNKTNKSIHFQAGVTSNKKSPHIKLTQWPYNGVFPTNVHNHGARFFFHNLSKSIIPL